MRIADKSLIILFPLALSGISLIAFSIGTIQQLFSVETWTLKCQRVEPTQNRCEITNTSISNTKKQLVPGQIEEADIDKFTNGYVVSIFTSEWDIIWLDSVSMNNKEEAQNKVNEINNFLKDTNSKSLTVTGDGFISFYKNTASILLLQLSLLLFISIAIDVEKTFIFRKALRRLEIKQKKILATNTVEYSFSEIKKIIYETKTDLDDDESKYHIIKIRFKSGKTKEVCMSRLEESQLAARIDTANKYIKHT